MKKVLASLAAGFLLAGTAATSVSAQEYKIKEGDTLNGIAENHDTTVDSLKDINDLDTDLILPGETLDIDGDQGQEQYKVKKGDTLGSISKEFDVSVSDLKEWNDLDSDMIVEGQKLNVQNASSTNNAEVTETQENATQENNQAEPKQEAPEEDQEAVVAEQEGTNAANDQGANQEEANQAEGNQEEANQADAGQEAVENDQAEGNQEAAEPEPEPENEESNNNDASEGETVSVSATAYTAQCDGCSGKTTDGTDLNANPDEKVIAVDPDVIPLGSKVHVEGYGDAVAADTGGAINGDKIDVHVPDEGEANAWGNKNVDVTILD